VPYAWEPSLTQVAVYVPWLTVSKSNPGSQEYLGTFSSDTIPNEAQAGQHITDAGVVVGSALGTLPAALEPLAATVTAVLAASTLARAFARNPDDLALAAALAAQYLAALKALQAAADNVGAATLEPSPVMYAPEPVPWGDWLIL